MPSLYWCYHRNFTYWIYAYEICMRIKTLCYVKQRCVFTGEHVFT